MASYETKTFKGTMKYLKLLPQAKKFKFLEINCSHYQATVLGSNCGTLDCKMSNLPLSYSPVRLKLNKAHLMY